MAGRKGGRTKRRKFVTLQQTELHTSTTKM